MVEEILQPKADALRVKKMQNILPRQRPSAFTTFQMSLHWSQADIHAKEDTVDQNSISSVSNVYRQPSSVVGYPQNGKTGKPNIQMFLRARK
jgi:hypothetical protein